MRRQPGMGRRRLTFSGRKSRGRPGRRHSGLKRRVSTPRRAPLEPDDRAAGRTCGPRAAKACWPRTAPLVVDTGKHTGRSAKDKFIVRDATTEDTVWWGKTNQPMDADAFDRLHEDFLAALGEQGRRCSSPTCSAARSPSTASTSASSTSWPGTICSSAPCWCGPEADELAGFEPEYHDHRPAELPRRPGAPRLPQRDGDRGQPRRRS